MYSILIWGLGYGYYRYFNTIKYQEILGEIKIVGITDKQMLYDCLDGYSFVPLSKISNINVDYIVVTSDLNFKDILSDAAKLGFSESMLIQAKVFLLPDFKFSKYVGLLNSKVSIISNNCWGGTIYHTLGMKFTSPFINMFETDTDYLKLLTDLRYYVGLKLKLKKWGFNSIKNIKYPIYMLGDIELHFNHTSDMNEVEKKWYERVERINWSNLFVMMFTGNDKLAYDFDKLNYDKKICFVPIKISVDSSYYLRISDKDEMKNVPFWMIVNKIASGHYHDYDLIDILHEGKIQKNRYFLNNYYLKGK